jgi:hypothetical protein
LVAHAAATPAAADDFGFARACKHLYGDEIDNALRPRSVGTLSAGRAREMKLINSKE